jgi:hypothetical protein
VAALGSWSAASVGTALASPPAALPWPTRLQLDFDVVGQTRGLTYRATSRLAWFNDAQRYQAQLEMRVRLIGSRTQTSTGLWRDGQLMPERHIDQARTERRYELDWTQQRFQFWRKGQLVREGPLEAGTQDRLSVFFALALQARQRLGKGSADPHDPWSVPVINQQGAQTWSFADRGPQRLETPAGTFDTRQLERLPGPHNDDTGITLWLSRSHEWLPARIRLADPNGDVVDQHLRLAS